MVTVTNLFKSPDYKLVTVTLYEVGLGKPQ